MMSSLPYHPQTSSEEADSRTNNFDALLPSISTRGFPVLTPIRFPSRFFPPKSKHGSAICQKCHRATRKHCGHPLSARSINLKELLQLKERAGMAKCVVSLEQLT
ncbi:hypothetical protein GE061_015928 [Apolygus lucorum]|uniref:Uncharacterized protein n=1 Tax=Apolygus lucorum TaxID=248454 RepID=A0A8S9XEP9_APOLU|nr:hypothetical protein GE061_015928 [Apolygus lucorum]